MDSPYSKNQSTGNTLLAYVLLLVVLGVLAWRFWPGNGGGLLFDKGGDKTAEPRVVTARGSLADDEKSTIELFKAASPSVVNITSAAVQRDRFNLNVQKIPLGSGSGFVWDDKGRIITNYHVVKGAGHFDLIAPGTPAWTEIEALIVGLTRQGR